jgi:hypothetical protein
MLSLPHVKGELAVSYLFKFSNPVTYMLLIKMQSYALKLGAPRPLISNPTCRVARVIDPEYANGADGGGAFDGWLCIKGTTGANNRKSTNAAAAPTKNSIRISCFRIDKTCILPFIRFSHRRKHAVLCENHQLCSRTFH